MTAPSRSCRLEDGLRHPANSKVSTAELRHEVEEYFALGAQVKAGDTVVDVGANVGAFSLRIAEACRSDVRLLCFEPSPETWQALVANFDENPILKQTRRSLHPVGLTSREKSGRDVYFYNFRRFPTNSTLDLQEKRREFEMFFEDRGQRLGRRVAKLLPGSLGRGVGKFLEWLVASLPKGPLGWWISKQVMNLEVVKIRVETLHDLLLRESVQRVDLLKIDVEGHEVDVLRGLEPPSWKLVNQVVVETHNRDGRREVIEAMLAENGLTHIRTVLQKTIDNGLESVLILASRAAVATTGSMLASSPGAAVAGLPLAEDLTR